MLRVAELVQEGAERLQVGVAHGAAHEHDVPALRDAWLEGAAPAHSLLVLRHERLRLLREEDDAAADDDEDEEPRKHGGGGEVAVPHGRDGGRLVR